MISKSVMFGRIVVSGLIALTTSCREQPRTPTRVASDPWHEQVAQVRRQQSDRIVVSRQRSIDDSDLRALIGLPVRELILESTTVTDQGVELIAGLKELEHIRLVGAAIGDYGLGQLAALPRLRFLNLPDAAFSDAGLVKLETAPQLELLRIGTPHMTDRGMQSIARLPHLRHLHLIGVPISDEGLRPLETMPQLESLYLDDVQLSSTAYARLFEVRKNDLHVHIDQLHHPEDPDRH